ncbi:LbetaH domain-containing protein [Methanolobus profundi]|uniref:Carbonic anhydrase or acetyltransferase, isoleucine patch superfamily n=1 Tax=Methanolobus profundi TaxID=487685 RepID=A0A1I4PQK9_9EURY|nr:carbonate dehydratase [Methanolobus profundi]SFM30181.1 Carbonic anhydrase or acetyltransferase, isoleucine patch superfamily [Methanolobus profundi]
MLYPNPKNQHPKISESAWISENAVIVGDVTIGENAYVAHNTVIRADEPGASIVIGDNCNIQDNVIIHGLSNSEVMIDNNTSLAHGCIVHGPCTLGHGCFVGFGAVVFDCNVGNDVVILHNATVRAVEIPARKVVPDGRVVTDQKDVEQLEDICSDLKNFKHSVIKANLDLVKGYIDLDCQN